jgi:predicted metalloendopeptidase
MSISQDKFECIPQNDLDCFYNKEWKNKQSEITQNEINTNNFEITQKKVNKEFIEFIKSAEKTDDIILNKLIMFRDSYYQRFNKYDSFRYLINCINRITTIKELVYVIKILTNLDIDTLFSISVSAHYRYPDIYTLSIEEFPITMESKEIYFDPEYGNRIKEFESVLKKVYQFIKKNWNYSNSSGSSKFVENIIVCEMLFAEKTLDLDKISDPKIICNSMLIDNFLEAYDVDHFWENILESYVTKNSYISFPNVECIELIKSLLIDITPNNLAMLKDYLVYSLVKKYGFYTDLKEALLELSPHAKDDDKLFIQLFYDTFGYYLEHIYEYKYGNDKKIKIIKEMFEQMKEYCIDNFKKTTIFTDQTKNEAIQKLIKMDIIVGRQKYGPNLIDLPVLSDNFFYNLMSIDSFNLKYMMKHVDQPIKRDNLSINNSIYSFIVNAYYDPSGNIIYIPTAILNDLFIKSDGDVLYNYGGMGAVIGHEMMHSFDNHGAQYDHLCHFHNWWTENDYNKFKLEIDKVMNHYASFKINDNEINSSASVGENIADIAGIKISFRTYMKHYMNNISSKSLSKKDKEHLKLFFKRWAEIFRSITNAQFIEYEVKVDLHAPNVIRINAPFSHLSEYYDIFNVGDHHFNYLEPHKRTIIMD